MSQCPYCGKKIAMSKAFCSKPCKENYFEKISIQVRNLFVRRIYLYMTPEEREAEIQKFCKRWKWRTELVKVCIEELAEEKGYIEASNTKRELLY